VHVYEGVAAGGVLAPEKDGVGVPHHPDVGQVLVLLRTRVRKAPLEVVGGDGCVLREVLGLSFNSLLLPLEFVSPCA